MISRQPQSLTIPREQWSAKTTRFIERLRSAMPERIAVIKPSALGDVVQALPLLPVLRRVYPRASISWVINRELSGLVAGHPDLAEQLTFDRRVTWSHAWGLARELRLRQFDLVFDLQGLMRTGVMTLATLAPMRVGLETAREGSAFTVHGLIPGTSRNVPASERYWRIAEVLGQGQMLREARLPVRDADFDWARDRLKSLPPRLIAFHVGAKWETKRWPLERFTALAARVGEHSPAAIVLVGGPGERELSQRLILQLRQLRMRSVVCDLTGETSLMQLAAVLASCDLLVSNDSGPLHLAAAMGCPTVGLFTATNPLISGPDSLAFSSLQTRVGCRNCYRKVCPKQGREYQACLQDLTVPEVWQHIAGRLQELPLRQSA